MLTHARTTLAHSLKRFSSPLTPVQAGAALWLIWNLVGAPAFLSVGFFAMLVPVQMCLSRLFGRLRSHASHYTDDRVKVTSEILSGMRVVKMYAWEQPFTDAVAAVRDRELEHISHTNTLKGLIFSIYFMSVAVAGLLTFGVYFVTTGVLNAYQVGVYERACIILYIMLYYNILYDIIILYYNILYYICSYVILRYCTKE